MLWSTSTSTPVEIKVRLKYYQVLSNAYLNVIKYVKVLTCGTRVRSRGRYLGVGGHRDLTGLICMAKKSNSSGELIKSGGTMVPLPL